MTNPNKALWEKGDFTRIAASMRQSGEALVERLGITKGMNVLDLGCGDGTTALPEARLGADVLGVDIASNLVAAGNERAKQEGLANCRFQEGDAGNLQNLADQSFDLVVSIFGAMFAPRPFEVAKEMVRVTKPGGRIVMGNWIPNDPTFNFDGTPAEFVGAFRKYYGPTMNAFEAAEKSRPSRGAPAGARGSLREPEQEPEPGFDVDSGDLSARDGVALSGVVA